MSNEPNPSTPQAVSSYQRERLRSTIIWAQKIRTDLADEIRRYAGRVHVRPSSTGVALVGLSLDGPQLGKPGYTNLKKLCIEFDQELQAHVLGRKPCRKTDEKRVQSYLIAEAYRNNRFIAPINRALSTCLQPCELEFVTDELFLPTETSPHGIGCDILACYRALSGSYVPVQMELKHKSDTVDEVIDQLLEYSLLVDRHAEVFAELFSAILGKPIQFAAPCEKWAVMPSSIRKTERFAQHNIHLVTYCERARDEFDFNVFAPQEMAAS